MVTVLPVQKQKLPRRPKRTWWISWSRRGNQKVVYTENSLEFGRSWEELSWNHWTSTPHRSETTGIAERVVRRVKEGTSAVLLQSGLGNEWWAEFMECYCYLRNIQDLLSDGMTPFERRFGKPFNGPVIPFGADGRISPYFCERPIWTTSHCSKSLARFFPRLCIVRGENLERRHNGRRHWRIGGDGCIWTPRPKAQYKKINTAKKWKFHSVWEHPP